MQPKDSPASYCPKCGSADPRLLSARPQYSLADPKHPIGMLAVYECECGAGFTAEEPLTESPRRRGVREVLMPGEEAENLLFNLTHGCGVPAKMT